MSRAPSTIHIKRKATDDPVDVLRVHELNGKRQRRATEFVFTRQSNDTSSPANDGPASAQLLQGSARRIKPLPRSSVQASAAAAPETDVGATIPSSKQRELTQGVNNLTPRLDLDEDSELSALQIAQHRRFHISRTSITRGRQSPVIGGKVQKRTPTVFVERRPGTPTARRERPRTKAESETSNTTLAPIALAEASRPQKKPGRSARTTPRSTSQPPVDHLAPASTSRDRNVRLPSGLVTPWDVTSEQLAKELEAYTLEEIGRNMAESAASEPKPPAASEIQDAQGASLRIKKGTSSKFKPKVPAQRYRDLHPESAPPPLMNEVDQDQTDDDGEFVIDTYIRMPAQDVDVGEKNHIGYIVLEDQPDIDEFYEDEDMENEEDEDYDEDDENAENHYTADYPDEEVDSDDEYDRNPYRYRTGNASDDEEFDEDDYDEMDDEDDSATRYPWLQSSKPSWMKREEPADDEDDEGDEVEDVKGNEDVEGNKNGKEDKANKSARAARDTGAEDEDMEDAHHAGTAHVDAKQNSAATATATLAR